MLLEATEDLQRRFTGMSIHSPETRNSFSKMPARVLGQVGVDRFRFVEKVIEASTVLSICSPETIESYLWVLT